MPTQCSLIIDGREKHITRHSVELKDITYIITRITVGDYAIIDPDGSILAIIERKSLSDAAASLKDGRWLNREKMIKLREQTGCKILMIIEGCKGNNPNQLCGEYTPYGTIESSLFHMMVRDNISTIWTADTIDTAKTLTRFVQSMDTLIKDMGAPEQPNGTDKIFCDLPRTAGDVKAEQLLTQAYKTPDRDIVREMWSCFKGISVTSADEFIKKYSLKELITKEVPRADIENFKLATGRKISKKAAESLLNFDKSLEVRILSVVPNISSSVAAEIIGQVNLAQLLSYDIGAMSIIKVGKTKRNLGEVKARQIKKFFDFKYQEMVGTSAADDADIENFLKSL